MTKIVKKILNESHANKALFAGVNQLADAVKVTLGPSGRCVVIDKQLGIPGITKDGVTVANSIYLEDQFEAMGCEILKEAAKQTAKLAGDGTTTAIILAQALVNGAHTLISNGKNPVFLAREFEKLCAATTDYIKKELSRQLFTSEECIAIATIAANNDKELGTLIGESVFKVGAKAPIIVEESHSLKSSSEMTLGYSVPSGLRSPFYYNVPGRDCWQGEDVSILIIERPFRSELEIEPIMDDHIKANKNLFIFCGDTSPIMDSLMVVNATRNPDWHYHLAASHSPDYGENRLEVLQDFAVLTGATLVTEDNSLPDRAIAASMLGKASFVKATEKMTVIRNDDAERKKAIENWIDNLEIRLASETDAKAIDFLKERIQKLKLGTVTLRIGGSSRYDVKERLDRVDDAVRASQCALEEGYVPGGGMTLVRAAQYAKLICKDVPLETTAAFCEALHAPFKQILQNAGESAQYDQILNHLSSCNKNMGVDLSDLNDDRPTYCDLIENNIVDPTKVVCTALAKACSISCTLITTSTLVADMTDVEGYNRMVNSLPMLRK